MFEVNCALYSIYQSWENDTVGYTKLGNGLDLSLEPQNARQGLKGQQSFANSRTDLLANPTITLNNAARVLKW